LARSTTSSSYLSATVKQPSSNLWSFAAWVYFQALPTAGSTILSLSTKSSAVFYFGIGINWTGSMARANAFVDAGGSELDATTTASFTATNTWYLVSGTFNNTASVITAYLNGGSSGTAAISGLPGAADTIGIGALANNGNFISHSTAWIAECAIWRALLAPNEFVDMYWNRRPIGAYRTGSLWFYAPLRGLSSSLEPDVGPYGNNLTLTGPPLPAPHPPVYIPRNPLKLARPTVGSPKPLPYQVIRPLTPHGQYDRWDYFP